MILLGHRKGRGPALDWRKLRVRINKKENEIKEEKEKDTEITLGKEMQKERKEETQNHTQT